MGVVASNRIFVANLVGLRVFGPKGEPIGKVRDIVAGLRADRQSPRVLGIVVEMLTRRRIFVPILRLSTIESAAVALNTGNVSMQPFEQRATELLLVGQLLDRKVRIATTRAVAIITDVAIEQTRTRDWIVSRLALRERTGPFARRAPVQDLAWGDVRGNDIADLLGSALPRAQALLLSVESMKPADAASVLRDMDDESRHELADALTDERLAEVMEELSEDDQKDLLDHLDEARAADVLEAMDPDDAADLLGELAPIRQARLLELMEPEESAPVRRLMQYSFDTAGGLMTSEPIVLPPDATVAEALAQVRNPELTAALASMVFVSRPPQATPTGRYLGAVHTQRLLREPPFELVAGTLDDDMARLSADAPLAEVTRYFATYNLVCAPVVDDEGHLLGAVTVDDLLDHLLPENWRDQGMDESFTALGGNHG